MRLCQGRHRFPARWGRSVPLFSRNNESPRDFAGRDFEWACRIARLDARPDRMVADVELSDERFCVTSPALVASLMPRFPNILSHTCVNDKGERFIDVAAHTSVPHLLEHLVIDEQARVDATPHNVVFVGKTAWVNRASRKARVQVSYASEPVARQAFEVAAHELNVALLAQACRER